MIVTVTEKMEELQLPKVEHEVAKESRGAIYSVPISQDILEAQQPSSAPEEATLAPEAPPGPKAGSVSCDVRPGQRDREGGKERDGSCAERHRNGRWRKSPLWSATRLHLEGIQLHGECFSRPALIRGFVL